MSAERHAREGRRADETNQRARGVNPRARATNPRARGTNPHPGKSELTGQWRAAWRRVSAMPPEDAHELAKRALRTLTRSQRDELAAVVPEVRELIALAAAPPRN